MTALNENAQKWVDALRSGEYAQTTGCLHRAAIGHCCLGVACDVARASGVPLDARDDGPYVVYDGADAVLPDAVQSWVGLNSRDGTFNGGLNCLSSHNDNGATFAQIADLIEAHADELGVSA